MPVHTFPEQLIWFPMESSVEQLAEQLQKKMSAKKRIQLLLQLSWALERTDPQRGLAYGSEALRLAESLGNTLFIARSLHFLGECSFYLADYSIALQHLVRAQALAGEIQDEDIFIRARYSTALVYIRTGDFTTARDLLEQNMLLLSQRVGINPVNHMMQLAVIQAKQGEYVGAVQVFFQILSFPESTTTLAERCVCYNNIASVYMSLHDYVHALEYYHKALDTYRTIGNRYGEATALLNIGNVYAEDHLFDNALSYLSEARTIFRTLYSRDREAWICLIIGGIYTRLSEYSSALRHLKAAFALTEKTGNREFIGTIHGHISLVYYKKKNYTAALAAAEKALPFALELGDRHLQYEVYQALADIHESRKDAAQSLKYYKLYVALKEEIQGNEQQRIVSEIQTRFEMERLEKEREIQQLRADQLQKEMEQKSKELTVLALQLVQKNECLAKLKRHIQSFGETDTKAYRTILRMVRSSLQPGNTWETFSRQFQQVHQNFYPRLQEACPTLTPMELKISSLVKINLSSKDIANLLSTSVRTVETHRRTIRKKLHLPLQNSLSAFLSGL